MSENLGSQKTATEVTEKILEVIYGPDLQGCSVNIQLISTAVGEGISSEVKKYKLLNDALIGAIRQIQAVSTPPNKEEIQSMEEVVNVLSQRADAIHEVTTRILEAWENARDNI